MSQPERVRDIQQEEALSAATELLHQPQRGLLRRNRGKIGLILGLGWGFAAGYMAARKDAPERPEQIQPQVQAKVVGVLLCGPEGCMALGELPFCDELPELMLPSDPIPQNFPDPHGSEPSAFDPTGVEL